MESIKMRFQSSTGQKSKFYRFNFMLSFFLGSIFVLDARLIAANCMPFEKEGVELCLENNFQVYKIKLGPTLEENANLEQQEWCDQETFECWTEPAIISVMDVQGVRRYVNAGPATGTALIAFKTIDLGNFIGKATVDLTISVRSIPYNASEAAIKLVVESGNKIESAYKRKYDLISIGGTPFTISQSINTASGPLTFKIFAEQDIKTTQSPFNYTFDILSISVSHYTL